MTVYAARYFGRRTFRLRLVRIELRRVDGAAVQAVDDLDLDLGAKWGRVFAAEIGTDSAHLHPPIAHLFGGRIVDTAGKIGVEYLRGLRGPLGETGVVFEPVALGTLPALRRAGYEVPELETERQLVAWLRGLDA